MTSLLEPLHIVEEDRIKEVLLNHLKKQYSSSSSYDSSLRSNTKSYSAPIKILSVAAPIDGLDMLSWLGAQKVSARGYWCDREDQFEIAGIGRADVITNSAVTSYEELMALMYHRIKTTATPIRYFGGIRFGDHSPTPEWDTFKSYRFVLPRFEVVRKADKITMMCNMRMDEAFSKVEEDVFNLVFSKSIKPPPIPRAQSRHDTPSQSKWSENVMKALDSFIPSEYEKVVLARRSSFTFNSELDSIGLLLQLKACTNQRFYFCFQPEAKKAFIGASPERLYRRDGKALLTEAIAGTRARGNDQTKDDILRKELIESDKEQREHVYVVKAISSSLQSLCEQVEVDPKPSLLTLSKSQHLITHFKAVLKDQIKDAQLLDALHPTPAVGGYLQEYALRDIEKYEHFSRGWFAGPVGWIGADEAQFAVGIRSALLDHDRLHVYAGAGLVNGSDPDKEWAELEDKIRDFTTLIS